MSDETRADYDPQVCPWCERRHGIEGCVVAASAPAVPVGVPAEVLLVHLGAIPSPEQHARYQETDPDGDYYDGPPVGVQPEPAEEPLSATIMRGQRATWDERHGPAVPVVHPEPGPEVMRAAQALMDRWEDGRDPTRCHLHIESEDPRTVAQVAVAAAVAAVRADTAREVELLEIVGERNDNDNAWNRAVAEAAALIRGES